MRAFIAPSLSERLGRQVVIENRPGAGTFLSVARRGAFGPPFCFCRVEKPALSIFRLRGSATLYGNANEPENRRLPFVGVEPRAGPTGITPSHQAAYRVNRG